MPLLRTLDLFRLHSSKLLIPGPFHQYRTVLPGDKIPTTGKTQRGADEMTYGAIHSSEMCFNIDRRRAQVGSTTVLIFVFLRHNHIVSALPRVLKHVTWIFCHLSSAPISAKYSRSCDILKVRETYGALLLQELAYKGRCEPQ
jgi:hypothetical protein